MIMPVKNGSKNPDTCKNMTGQESAKGDQTED